MGKQRKPLFSHFSVTFNFSGFGRGFPKSQTQQMDAEGLGRKLLLTTPPSNPRKHPEKQTVGTVTASPIMLALQAPKCFELSHCLHCKERLPGPDERRWVPSSSLSPKPAASIYTLHRRIQESLEPLGPKSPKMSKKGLARPSGSGCQKVSKESTRSRKKSEISVRGLFEGREDLFETF